MVAPGPSLRSFWRHYIGGKWVDGIAGKRIDVENPATAETLAEVALAEACDVDAAVDAARLCADQGRVADMRPEQRMTLMFRIAAELEVARDEIAWAECLDNGKRISDARGEAAGAARYFTYYGGLADKLEGRVIPLGVDYLDYTLPTPHGVSAHIVPWNYPINIAARSLSCALATGNSVVIKSPELSPLSVCLLVEACERAGVPAGAVNLICGYGHDAGAALVSHPAVDHIVFTGSVPTGRAILHAAAERVCPCTMELGGKSAAIVFPDANLDEAVSSIMIGIYSNAGQICSAASRVLVHQSVHDALIERLYSRSSALTIGPGRDDADITPLISGIQLDRVENHCLQAVREGARCVIGGRRVPDTVGHFMSPTLFADVRPAARIAQEEVFGPVLTILAFGDEAEAIHLANGTDYGLVAGVYTEDVNRAHRVARQLIAGQVFVNEWFAGGVETPFGGVRRSGYGREKGQEALLGYVNTKNVAVRLRR